MVMAVSRSVPLSASMKARLFNAIIGTVGRLLQLGLKELHRLVILLLYRVSFRKAHESARIGSGAIHGAEGVFRRLVFLFRQIESGELQLRFPNPRVIRGGLL